ncbi:MAG: hypothetical protein GX053_11925 [Tissierella sp.]|nr:hypothetical protein [Tissierella sp.]
MDRIHNKSQRIINNFVYIGFVFIIMHLFGLGINLDLSFSLQLALVAIGSIMVKIFLFNPLILYILLAMSFLGGILVYHYVTPFFIPLVEKIYYLFENIIYNFQGKENIADENILLYWILLIVFVSLFNAFVIFKNRSIYLLLPVYVGAFLYYWYNFYDQSYWFISIFFLGFFILMGYYKFRKETDKLIKKASVDVDHLYSPWIKTVSKYSVFIVIMAVLLPKNYNYISWPWLQHRVYTVFPFVENLRSYDTYTRTSGEAGLFNFSMTSTENASSRLGGPVNLSDKRIMTVYSTEANYLRGSVQHTYTGNEWQTIRNPISYHRVKENFSDWSGEDMKSYYNYVILTIQNHDFASTTLFSPYKPAFVDFKDQSDIVLNRDDILGFPHGVYDGESYTIWTQKPLPYGILLANRIDLTIDQIDDLDIYLQIPEDKITDRTRDLTKEIIANSQSDYQKAIAIEDYLRNNFEYNLSPKMIPDGSEFIDYFLFEGQEGYCTYYATTMAIMLRLEGIPTRYVEGYLAFDSIDDGIYEVRHDNAHAWIEAFIEPVGWMQFEPTPAFPAPTRLENYRPEVVEETHDRDIISNDTSERDKSFDQSEIIDDVELGFNGAVINNEDVSEDQSDNKAIAFVISLLLMILPLRYLVGFYRYKSKESKAKKLSPNKRILFLYGEIVSLIDLIGYSQISGETHYEYAQRVAYKFYDLSGDDVKGIIEITDIFVRSKYGNITSSEDIMILEEFREKLKTRLKNQGGIIKYYYSRYVG